ncbi:MAG: PH domain-containing protein [Patescibacteria group bacterium]
MFAPSGPVSELQTRFPLSVTRKFWKKFLSSLIFGVFCYILAGGILALVAFTEDPDIDFLKWIGYTLIVFTTLYLLLMYWYHWTYIKLYYYSADADFLTIKKGVFAPAEIHVQYQKIQDVYVDQDILDLLFGIYDVHVASATATSSMEAHIDGLSFEHAEQMKVFLLESLRRGATQVQQQGAQTGVSSSISTGGIRNPVALATLKEISRDRYPLTKEWYVGELLKTFLQIAFSLPLWYFVIFFGASDDDGTSFVTMLSPNAHSLFIWSFVGLAGLFIIWQFIKLSLWVMHYRYQFTDEFIEQRVGILTVEEKHMPYSVVQNIVVKQGVIDRILGIADVQIENAATVVVVQGKGAPIKTNSSITIEGLFLKEADGLAGQLRHALFGTPASQSGL